MTYNVVCITADHAGNTERLMPKTFTLEDAVREAVRLKNRCRDDHVCYVVVPYGAWIGRADLITVYLSEDYLI